MVYRLTDEQLLKLAEQYFTLGQNFETALEVDMKAHPELYETVENSVKSMDELKNKLISEVFDYVYKIC